MPPTCIVILDGQFAGYSSGLLMYLTYDKITWRCYMIALRVRLVGFIAVIVEHVVSMLVPKRNISVIFGR